MTLMGVSAFAYDVKVDDDTYMKTGVKAQLQFLAANPDPDKLVVSLANARIYFSGQITNMVKFGFNYDFASSGALTSGGRASDALVSFDLAKELKVNVGIYRMAVSRVALQDSYQYILVHAPDVAGSALLSAAPPLAGYRNAGLTVWGDLADGMIRYNVGFWDGANSPAGVASTEIGMSGRLVLNLMDPEKGYTCPGCYLGKAKVANVGVGYFTQDNSAGDETYKVTTVDGFYDANNMTLEGAYFMYDDGLGIAGSEPSGWYVQAAYAFGNIQPAARYESWDDDDAIGGSDYTNMVAGVNYLISGNDAKVGFEWKRNDPDLAGSTKTDTYTLQVQVQF
jgi:hypothetical protein